jgi:hypothetical protein
VTGGREKGKARDVATTRSKADKARSGGYRPRIQSSFHPTLLPPGDATATQPSKSNQSKRSTSKELYLPAPNRTEKATLNQEPAQSRERIWQLQNHGAAPMRTRDLVEAQYSTRGGRGTAACVQLVRDDARRLSAARYDHQIGWMRL